MIVDAVYRPLGLPPRYRDNPLIEALPPMLNESEQIGVLINIPEVGPGEAKNLSYVERMEEVLLMEGLYVPPRIAADLGCQVDRAIRRCYQARNPLSEATVSRMYTSRELVAAQNAHSDPLSGGILLLALSASGKSRLITACLSRYPQTIKHTNYAGHRYLQTQVVWISVLAPVDGSMKGLLLRILVALERAAGISGTEFSRVSEYKRMTVETLILEATIVAENLKLGILHIDDLQRLGESVKGKKTAIQHLMQFTSEVRCPILCSGTVTGVAPLIESGNDTDLELVRRLASWGHYELPRPKKHEDKFFRSMVNGLLKYQWTDEPMATNEKVYETLFAMSAGIPGILTTLHRTAQFKALSLRSKTFELSHYFQAYKHEMRPYAPVLRALRRDEKNAELRYEELVRKLKKKKMDDGKDE